MKRRSAAAAAVDSTASRPRGDPGDAPDIECSVCQVLAVPPVTVTPCGHTLCGECFTTLRARGNSIGGGARGTLNFRCPQCRRAVTSFAVSDALRRIVLAVAPESLDKGDGVALAVRDLDARFMQQLQHGMPGESAPTLREIYDAHASDDESGGDGVDILQRQRPPHAVRESRLVVAGSSSSGQMSRQHVGDAINAVMTLLTNEISAHEIYPDWSGGTEDEESEESSPLPPPYDAERILAMVNCRVPRDLRMWTQHGDVYTYQYWRAPLSPDLEERFVAQMRGRGVVCERYVGGYLLTLPEAETQRFLTA